MSALDPRTPVLVGWGVAMQRIEDPLAAKDALGLMLDAVARAGADCGTPALLADVGYVAVPKGRWEYGNAAGMIARHVGAARAVTVGATVGVLQQTLLGKACQEIAEGRCKAALVAGGDAGYRILRSQITGVTVADTPDGGKPDMLLAPKEELRHPAELRVGLRPAVGLYAIMESAYRASQGIAVGAHQERLARLYSRFSEIAAGNEHAWRRQALDADAIRVPSAKNPVQAFPYNKLHCSAWSVDQAAALLFCSVQHATALGIPREKWVFPLASSESNNMVPVAARARLGECPGARIAGLAALGAAGIGAEQLGPVELYSCFPIAVALYAAALGIELTRDLTVTGGMPFAGGPYNNYMLQAACRMAELLRRQPGAFGLVSTVSGVLTKQGFGVWSTEPNPNGFQFADVTDEVAQAAARKPVLEQFEGAGIVAGYTVLHERGQPPRAIVVADVAGDARAVASCDDPGVVARLQESEFCGASVELHDAAFVA